MTKDAAINITTLDLDKISVFPNNQIRISENDLHWDVELEFARRLQTHTDEDATYLFEFCENISMRILRMFLVEDDIDVICEILAAEWQCDPKQAHCLIELTLELIYVKRHGYIRQEPNVDLSYLIAMASSALQKQ